MKALPLLAAILLPVAVASAQDVGGTYVSIGEYTDDVFATTPATPAPTVVETVPLSVYETAPVYEAAPVLVPEPVAVLPDAYAAPVVYTQPVAYAQPEVAPLSYGQSPVAVAPGFADAEYEAARLAAYDANGDGTVTTAEAVATLRPLGGS